jgi:hypothetical protein
MYKTWFLDLISFLDIPQNEETSFICLILICGI